MSALAFDTFQMPKTVEFLANELSASLRMEFVVAIGQLRAAVVVPLFESGRTRDALALLREKEPQVTVILRRMNHKLTEAVKENGETLNILTSLQRMAMQDLIETARRLWGEQAGRDAEVAALLLDGLADYVRKTLWDAPYSGAYVDGPTPAMWRRLEARAAFLNCVSLSLMFADTSDLPKPRPSVMRALIRHFIRETRDQIAEFKTLVEPVPAGTLAQCLVHTPHPEVPTDRFLQESLAQMLVTWRHELELLA